MRKADKGVTLKAGRIGELSGSLNDVAELMKAASLDLAAKLMKSASNQVSKYGASGTPESMLSDEAPSDTAKLMHADIQAASADPATVAKVTAELVAAAYASF